MGYSLEDGEIFISFRHDGKIGVWIPASGINDDAYLFITTDTYFANTFNNIVVTKKYGINGDTFTTTINNILLDKKISIHNGMQNTRPLEISRFSENSLPTRYFKGIIDEIQISNIARSSSWIDLQYQSQNNTLLTFGSEESI